MIYEWLARFGFAQDISQDDRVTLSAMQQIAHDKLQSASYTLMMQDIDKAKAAVRARTAWRIEGTFREFPKLPPLNLWFDYPIHRADEDEVLKDAKYDGEFDPKQNLGRKKSKKELKAERNSDIEVTFEGQQTDGIASIKDMAEASGKSEDTVRRHLKEHGGCWIENGRCGRKQ